MAQAVPIIMVVMAVVAAVQAKKQGDFAAAAADRERVAAEEAAAAAKLQASQEEVLRLEKLRRTKGQQLAAAAALGFDPFSSRSFFAIRTETERLAGRDVANIKLMGLMGERRFLQTATGLGAEASAERTNGNFSAAGKLLGGAGSALKAQGNTTTPADSPSGGSSGGSAPAQSHSLA